MTVEPKVAVRIWSRILVPCAVMMLAFVALLVGADRADAAFGIKKASIAAVDVNGNEVFQAGSHPSVNVFVEVTGEVEHPEGDLRGVVVELPPGVVGNPQSVASCPQARLESFAPLCPGDSQIGVAHIVFSGLETTNPVFSLAPPKETPASLGFSAAGLFSYQNALLRSDIDYGLTVVNNPVPNLEIESIRETLWGVPASPVHDAERVCIVSEVPHEGCAAEEPERPFLTMPTSCGRPLQGTISINSLEEPPVFHSETVEIGSEFGSTALDGCNKLEFEPSVIAQPTTNRSDSPTGLDFSLHQPQHEDPDGLATANLRNAQVTLPAGMSVNPSAANGLGACGEGEMGYQPSGGQIHFSKSPQTCPNASKIGTLEVKTPLLKPKLQGAIFLGTPFKNPFGSLLSIYLAIEDQTSGINAKLAGQIQPDPTTGQLTATFTENPQLPIEDIELHFFGGTRGALQTPLACGPHTTTTTLTPWSSPEGVDVHPTNSFTTSVSASGSGTCPASEVQAPPAVAFTAGTESPVSGAYSPFTLRLARADGTQRITGVDTTLPTGLLGKLAGVSYCPPSGIAKAIGREQPEQGKLEQAEPSCPPASEVGTVQVTAGSGITPIAVSGHVYLAGPYRGAPISLVVIVPAIAGPFDLGTVVDRVALNVGEYDARIHATADPLPTIRDGIPLDVRSIELRLVRPTFTLNPTSCQTKAIEGTVTMQTGQALPLTNSFQVGECKRLAFKPSIALSLKGATKRTGHPALKAVVTYPQKGPNANIAQAQVSLPHSEFLDQDNIGQACTKVILASRGCPATSIYGSAKVWTPLLDQPLEGPVYLVGGYGYKLPALVAELGGQIKVLLVGKVDTSKSKGIRNTFEAVPDAPVDRFVLELKGGKKYGLLENSENLCRKKQKAEASFEAQNGATLELTPRIVNGCKGRHATKKHGAKGKSKKSNRQEK